MANEKVRRDRRAKKTKGNKKFYQKRSGQIILGVLLLLTIGIVYLLSAKVVEPLYKVRKEPVSILLVGSDVDGYREEHYGGTKPEKTDSLMVATFNPDTYKVVMTSIPRDTAIDYVCEGNDTLPEIRGKVNEIYPASGNDISCLQQSISNFLNVPIDYYVKVNMDQFGELVDLVGPLTIEAYADDGSFCQENVDLTQTYCFTNGETYEMDSDEALSYSRFRKDSGKDYSRGVRQQQVLAALAKSMLANGLNAEGISQVLEMVETDMEVGALYGYYEHVSNVMDALDMANGEKDVDVSVLPDSVWSAMFEKYDYSNTEVTNENVENFIKEQGENFSLKEYFLNSYQFSDNYKEGGYFLATEETRAKVSNALRANLNLDEEATVAYKNNLAANYFHQSVADDGTYYSKPVVGEEPTEEINVVEEPATDDESPSESQTPTEDNSEPEDSEQSAPENENSTDGESSTDEENSSEESVEDTTPPTISGTSQYTINEGEQLATSPSSLGLTATDETDGQLTNSITLTNNGGFIGDGTDGAGNYTLTYSVADKTGNTANYSVTIEVLASTVETDEPVENETSSLDNNNLN